MLDESLKGQLAGYLERLQRPIQLTVNADGSEVGRELRELVNDVAGASAKVSVVESAAREGRKPTFGVSANGEQPRVTFAGLPMGHEFTSLVLALLHVGGHPPKEDASLLEQVKQLQGTFEFETYFSATCQNCPDVVQALNLMSALNPNVKHTAIDGSVFQDEVKERQVMAVPTVYLNGERFGQGRMELAEIVAKLDTAAAARNAEKLNQKSVFDVLIVGAKVGKA